jgi:SAM-dependent methyltransferase
MDRERWNRRYREKDLLWSAEPNRFLAEEVGGLDPGRALDLAAGEGRNAIWLAELGWRVTAVEFADEAIDRGRRIAGERGVDVDWIEADLLKWRPEPAVFDLVLVLYLHLPSEGMATVMDRAQRAIAPGGTLLLIGHDRTNLDNGHGGPQDPEVLYTALDIAPMVAELDIEEAGTRLRPVDTDHGTVDAIDCLFRASRPL